MKILLTGATGYIGQRLLPILLENGHEVVCCVRDANRFNHHKYDSSKLRILEVDFLDKKKVDNIPEDIDIAYYLIHSMASSNGKFEEKEQLSAENFIDKIQKTNVKQVIYLSGIINESDLSRHLSSRKNVEQILSSSRVPLTTLRAGIIIGSGSASFEIIRDLVEKLPLMVAPKWLNTKCQPIGIRNVIEFLNGVMLKTETYDQSFDIGGTDVLTYKEMLLRFAEIRGLKRNIIIVPVLTRKLSSYWLYFITSTSFTLARYLVESMKVEMVCRENYLAPLLSISLIDYETSIKLAFDKIAQDNVLSSWKDAQTSDVLSRGIIQYTNVPSNGCYKDVRKKEIKNPESTLNKIWSIGGANGWYSCNFLWHIRGFFDRLLGGVGIGRGRKNRHEIYAGETLDFWRVLLADKNKKRFLLYAEMKLPGEAWLEFNIDKDNILTQTATFRPIGLPGRIYWYLVMPFHGLIFRGMINKIAE